MLVWLGAAGVAPDPAIQRVLVLETTAPSIATADREQLEQRIADVLHAGEVRTAESAARQAARACETQVCLQRTAIANGITHWMRAEITGDDRDYRVRVTAGRIGDSTALAESAGECTICGMDDLAAALEARTVSVRDALTGESVARPRTTWRRPVGPEPLRDRGPKSALRPTGIALLALGSASVVGGAVLLGIDGQDVRRRCDTQNLDAQGDCRFVHETQAGGIAMLTGGIVAAAGGITLISIDRKRRRADVRMRLGYNRIVLLGRF
ncbi:MAG TPA: hypothetical protein VG755_36000 [Nannocystaceae bacterium]|nr:hypothetical protein [Nannocystaceae bacterium]